MNYRRLGRTGLKVSRFCLGTMQWGWTADEPTAYAVMDAFVEHGGNFLTITLPTALSSSAI